MSLLNRLRRSSANRHQRSPAPAVGIDIANSALRFAQQQRTRQGSPWITGKVPLAGLELDGTSVTARRIADQAKSLGLETGRASGLLLSTEIEVFPIAVKPIRNRTIESQIISLAGDHLSYPINQAVIDYVVIPPEAKRSGDSATPVLVFSVPTDLTEKITSTLDQAGYVMDSLITPACALARPISVHYSNKRHLLIVTSNEATSISIIQGGHVLLERFLSWNLNQMFARLETELDLSETQCLSLLAGRQRGQGLDRLDDLEEEQIDPLGDVLQDILAPSLADLAHEAAGCISYCDSQLVAKEISSFMLAGPLPDQQIICNSLSSILSIPGIQLDVAKITGQDDSNCDFAREFTMAACLACADQVRAVS